MWISLFIAPLFGLMAAVWPFTADTAKPDPISEKIKETALELPSPVEPFFVLRVLVSAGKKSVTVESAAPYEVFDKDGRRLFYGDKLAPTQVVVSGSSVKIGNQLVSNPAHLRVKDGVVKLGTNAYRNGVTFWGETTGNISVINNIHVDDYLKGVLPWEANPAWDHEALKAQAVVSRTYALFQAVQRKDDKYDLSSDVMSQVYKGSAIEKKETNRAVEETVGQILLYQKKIFPAYFHSTCGGHTTNAESNWDVREHPVLKGVVCQFCRNSKHYYWKGDFTEVDILKKLKTKGHSISSVDKIDISDKDKSGRVQTVKIVSGSQIFKFRANDFRIWMDPFKFKSTKISKIEKTGGVFHFQGNGWGHGVGLCQYGMKNLGELGYSYKQILDYYFPGSGVSKV